MNIYYCRYGGNVAEATFSTSLARGDTKYAKGDSFYRLFLILAFGGMRYSKKLVIETKNNCEKIWWVRKKVVPLQTDEKTW